MQHTPLNLLADTYNCGAYGAGGYDQNTCAATTTTGNASNTQAGALAYTGEPWFWMLVAAVIIIAVSLIVLLRSKKRRK